MAKEENINIKDMPLAQHFSEWIKQLSLEHRLIARDFAQKFLVMGALHGTIGELQRAMQLLSGVSPSGPKDDDLDKWLKYVTDSEG